MKINLFWVMLGNALEEEAGCHRTCKALQEKILGVVWRVTL